MKLKRLVILIILSGLVAVGCVRPTPRPENVQITEVPILATFPATPTSQVEATAVSPTGDASGGENPTANVTVEAPNSGPQTHEVIAGDTLSRISIIYGISIEELMAANDLDNPDALELGQILTIPVPGSIDLTAVANEAEPDPETTATPATVTNQSYIVQAGDTLFRIALAYGLTVEELAEFNDITDINNLEVGQEIRIP